MTTFLADANVLVAMVVVDHVHHDAALGWFESAVPALATCPITQGALLRFLIRAGSSADTAASVLDTLQSQKWHRFWLDDIPYGHGLLGGVIGHRQVTDAYLVGLAQHHKGKLVTLDRGLAVLHGSAVELIAT